MGALALLLFATLQRLAELIHARRNTRRLLAEGAVEIGADHYPLLVLLHAAWLGSLWLWLAEGRVAFNALAALAYLVVQLARLWVMASLGRYWTTRILIPRDAALVRRGPYRFLKHPNYAVVAAEIVLLPLALGAWPLALLFAMLNAVALVFRIRIEETGLAPRRRPA
jgi:methyltransferase